MNHLSVPKRIGTKPYADTLREDLDVKRECLRAAGREQLNADIKYRMRKSNDGDEGLRLQEAIYKRIRAAHAFGSRNIPIAKEAPKGILDELRLNKFKIEELSDGYLISW